jgi:hypothetical protein
VVVVVAVDSALAHLLLIYSNSIGLQIDRTIINQLITVLTVDWVLREEIWLSKSVILSAISIEIEFPIDTTPKT